jgi:multiple sugar transport system permease protein
LFYYGLLATIFLPPSAASLVTTFNLLQSMNLMNSLWALILPVAFGGQAVTVVVLRQFIEDIPKDLFESAQIDGAGHFRQIFYVVIPLTSSAIGVLAIQTFIYNWNELMLPLIMIRDEARQTIPVSLMMLDGEYHKQWGPLMAAYAISSIPLIILFSFAMRYFVRGLAAGAVKG